MMPTLRDTRIGIVKVPPVYPQEETNGENRIGQELERLTRIIGWYNETTGPFGNMIPRGARVLVKPNWVIHENYGPWGIEPLLTHASIVRAVVEGVLCAQPSAVFIGDAPIQSCDFDHLLRVTGLLRWTHGLMARDARFLGSRDFRRTKCVFQDGVRQAFEDQLPLERFILFDLGVESLLEPITDKKGSFRVTQYDPRAMATTHGPGRHQYLVAREVIEADVIINLPKLKTHKKAGMTCALKNLIGINGNKEYLPHHRINGSALGGDCYPGFSLVKRALEFSFDRMNVARSRLEPRVWYTMTRVLNRVLHAMGDELGVEGSWSGNDTIWRTCLDLNRVLLYGRSDGTLSEKLQRTVLHVVDAVVAGQGDGPLSSQPLPLGLMLAGGNAAAVDRVASRLLGYDPERLPIVSHAFDGFSWPIACFRPSDILLLGDLGSGGADEVLQKQGNSYPVIYPAGWRDAITLSRRPSSIMTARPRSLEGQQPDA